MATPPPYDPQPFTEQDVELFRWLWRVPLTLDQLLKLSVTFENPFRDREEACRCLKRLRNTGLVNEYQYAWGEDYYSLTRQSYDILRLVFPEDVVRSGPEDAPWTAHTSG